MQKIKSPLQESTIVPVTPEVLSRLKAQAAEAIQMKADIKTVISVFSEVMESMGMKEMSIQGGDIQAVLPAIVRKLTQEMMMGTFNTQALANIAAVMPIIEKYKHLADE